MSWFKRKPKCEHDWIEYLIEGREFTDKNVTFMQHERTITMCGKCGEQTYPDSDYLSPLFRKFIK
jgi:hypothetical protein